MKKLRGFTLIELMIVISIIAILAAIIAPAVKHSHTRVECVSSIDQSTVRSPVELGWDSTDRGSYVSVNNASFTPRPGDSCRIVNVKEYQ